jgi:hypothetical protein
MQTPVVASPTSTVVNFSGTVNVTLNMGGGCAPVPTGTDAMIQDVLRSVLNARPTVNQTNLSRDGGATSRGGGGYGEEEEEGDEDEDEDDEDLYDEVEDLSLHMGGSVSTAMHGAPGSEFPTGATVRHHVVPLAH